MRVDLPPFSSFVLSCDMMTDACMNERSHKHTMNDNGYTCIPMNDESQHVSGKLDCGLFVPFYVMVFLGLDCFCFLSLVVPVEPLSGALTYSLRLSLL